jgi:RecA/RadA recombinase
MLTQRKPSLFSADFDSMMAEQAQQVGQALRRLTAALTSGGTSHVGTTWLAET